MKVKVIFLFILTRTACVASSAVQPLKLKMEKIILQKVWTLLPLMIYPKIYW